MSLCKEGVKGKVAASVWDSLLVLTNASPRPQEMKGEFVTMQRGSAFSWGTLCVPRVLADLVLIFE